MFIHLHTHSHYSLLDGLPKIPELVRRAKELKMTALALTDHGVLYGAIEFYNECKKAGIKPIIGIEAYLAPRRLCDKEAGVDSKSYHLILLAQNEEGYKNLLKLTTIAHLEGYYYKPRIDKEVLKKYNAGLIGSSACLQGEIPRMLLSENPEAAVRALREYQEIFGADNFYLEIQNHRGFGKQEIANQKIIELSQKTGAPLVLTRDIHYINPEDAEAQDALLCIQVGSTLDNPNRLSIREVESSFTSEKEMREAFSHLPEAMENTVKIANQCNLELKLGSNILPKFQTPAGRTIEEYLQKLCLDGLSARYEEITSEIRERLEWELSTINKMGFASYFLIVADFVNFAKKEGIVVGPGRGSAAGSLVSYLLGITDLDPLKYKLLFERFLNPDRISMPDIDLDFSDLNRDKVIEYVRGKYGAFHVAGVITFGTMAARASIRDVGRVLGLPYAQVDRIAKMISPPIQGRHIPLAKSIIDNPDLAEIYHRNGEIKRLMNLAIKLEGTVRHASQHACAIVIGDQPLTEYTALQKAQGGNVEIVTQYSMHPIEEIGLLKMDILGLANLSIIQDALEIIEATLRVGGPEAPKIDIEKIPLDDKKTFALLSRGETTGVFQLESSGMKRCLKELKPSVFEDIIAIVAMYRPGPMQFIDSFIRRKHGKEKIVYPHPLMEQAIQNTYGTIIYQEQVMQLSKEMAGFTGGEADTLRKAIGKKIPELMAKMRTKFVEGSVKNGVRRELAATIFQQIEDFAAYSFNRAHAACYAMIAYRTAYLKTHWPNCFMAALMNSESGNLDRITIDVEECKALGLEVLPPDINESFARFAVVPKTNKIRFGLLAIKNIGSDIVEAIISERKAGGKYDSLEDFLERVEHKNLNKKSLESLIKCGALDLFGERGMMLANLDKILAFRREIKGEGRAAQNSLFEAGGIALSRPAVKLEEAEIVPDGQKLLWEKELLGLYVTAHPFAFFEGYVKDLVIGLKELEKKKEGEILNIAGVVAAVKTILTKKGETMNFVKLEDLKSSAEVVVFPSILSLTRDLWQEDKVIIIRGRVSFKEGAPKIIAERAEIVSLENVENIKKIFTPKKPNEIFNCESGAPYEKELFFGGNLTIKDDGIYLALPSKMQKTQAEAIKNYLKKYPGETQVFLEIGGGSKIIPTPFKVDKKMFLS